MKKTVTVPEETITLITEKQAAEFLGMKRRTLQDWRRAGYVEVRGERYKGPKYYQIGARPMYTEEDLTAWAASRQVG